MTTTNIQEDEIDLRELFSIIWQRKIFIIIFTSIVTIGAIIFAYSKTPIYEVKSNIQIGYIGEKLLIEPKTLEKTLNIVFNVEHKNGKNEKFISEVSSISLNKKLPNFIQVTTNAISNNEATKKNKEVVTYIENSYLKKIDRYITTTNISIRKLEKQISHLNNFETKQLKQEIEKIKNQTIKDIDKQISFLKTKELTTVINKIKISQTNLDKYIKSIEDISKNIHNKNSSTQLISSIQLLNYQNLIFDTKNKLEDLKLKRDNILEFKLSKLEHDKTNITNQQLQKLDYKLNVEFKNKEESLLNKIEEFKYNISSSNIMNSKLIGDFQINNYPIKPKKKLIVVVSFVTSFILSIFIVFFLDFISKSRGIKES